MDLSTNKDFCFVVFSHAGTDKKESILKKSLKSIKTFGIPVILCSHLPVSEENQNLCNYFIKDCDNLIISEADFFNNPVDINHPVYYIHDSIANRRFSTGTFKKSYQPGVFNLYTNGFGLAKKLGFKNAILWEFDFEMGPITHGYLKAMVDNYSINGYSFFGFNSFIQDLKSFHAIPSIFSTDLITRIFPEKPITDPNLFSSISKMMIMEQWVQNQIELEWATGQMEDFSMLQTLMPDLKRGEVDSQKGSPLFFDFRSGIYFDENSPNMCYFSLNSGGKNLSTEFEIRDAETEELLYQANRNAPQNNWYFDNLSPKIVSLARTDRGLKVTEKIQGLEGSDFYSGEYFLNSKNLDFMKKLKKFVDPS